MVREERIDQCDNRIRDGIGLEGRARCQHPGSFSPKSLPVVGVKVPLAAGGLTVVHQNIVALAQLAVKVFQPQLLASLGMGCEIAHCGEEVTVFANFQGQACRFDYGF